jgi:hypothetical protein
MNMGTAIASSAMHCQVEHNSLDEFDTLLKIGFEWRTQLVDLDGQPLTPQHRKKNLYPTEGLNATLDILLGTVGKLAGAYIGLFSGNYNPTISDIAASVSAASGETNLFVGPASRKLWVSSGAAAAGSINNYNTLAQFQFTGTTIIYGGFLIASSAVGSTGGPLISIVRFGSPYQVQNNTILNVGAGCTLASA